ncbi:hypothetical protein ABE85_09290 [Mitsuaria sp. 7]|nr:hypothetical protein ABE85_09290 [Mitsuaria sp. 7]
MISGPVRGLAEKSWPTTLKVVRTRSAASARAATPASGAASSMKRAMVSFTSDLAACDSGASRYSGAASLSATRMSASSHSDLMKVSTSTRSRSSGGRLRSSRMRRSVSVVSCHSSDCNLNRMAALFGKYW